MTSSMQKTAPTLLCILDGWGERAELANNAIVSAKTPTWDRLKRDYPSGILNASENFVGLPSGQMGNSEVGHMNLGAGRVVMQDLPKIDAAIESGELARNETLLAMIQKVKAASGRVHILGLLSDGGVHSHEAHIISLAKIFGSHGIDAVVHGFLDGRDTPPQSALTNIDRLKTAGVSLASLCGRYWAMDRDLRWDRVQKAYDLIVRGDGVAFDDPREGVEASYAQDVSDEFVEPIVLGGYRGMQDGDGLLMVNFRADRAREILSAFLDPDFDGFEKKSAPVLSSVVGMVSYSSAHDQWMDTLFPAEDLKDVLGEVAAAAGLKQLRIAETEKYAHVTFFFNGGREDLFEGEERVLVKSPDVATYDLRPEMSAPEVTDHLETAIKAGEHQLIVVNYANTDMVGHTGNFDAAVKAVEAVDACLARLLDAVASVGGQMLITADHGNADMMVDPNTGVAHTAHTLSPVPVILVGTKSERNEGLAEGRLADVAPTLLDMMGLNQPAAMTGRSLLRRRADAKSVQAAE